jgi:putative (di)nucleoside polyphosphate hydrolase
VIDSNGFRSNVGIILVNHADRVLWAKRLGRDAWQFPQGGMQEDETPEQTLFRELQEEIGLSEKEVTILGRTRHWLKYRLPIRMIRKTEPVCIGQKQLWFLLRLEVEDHCIHFNQTLKPEFDGYQWVNYWYPLRQVILFKREVYRRALKELAPYLFRNAVRDWGVQPINRLLDK